ncbi:hypothetical protein D2M30_0834 [Bacillus amyloliquefaciens]|nr:hypothetical protein D2M30_0834 [Bacillus amyloliquefaciens]
MSLFYPSQKLPQLHFRRNPNWHFQVAGREKSVYDQNRY